MRKWVQFRDERDLLAKENETLKLKVSSLEKEKEDQKTKYEEELNQFKTESSNKQTEWDSKRSESDTKIKNLEDEVIAKQEYINKTELKKMARAYGDQESAYNKSVKNWLGVLIVCFSILVASTSLSIHFALGKLWYDRFEFYLVDFIILSAVWFSAAQYAYHVKLRNDYANRKTLAQTYHNILLSITEASDEGEKIINKETRGLFMEKAIEVLCASSIIDSKEPVLTKEVLKNLATLLQEIKPGA